MKPTMFVYVVMGLSGFIAAASIAYTFHLFTLVLEVVNVRLAQMRRRQRPRVSTVVQFKRNGYD